MTTTGNEGSGDATERALPPYEGRTGGTEGEAEGGTHRDGARVGGATGPVRDDQPKQPDPADTPGGKTAAPADEQPAEQMPDGTSSEQGTDLGSHITGVGKGEDRAD